MRRTLSIVALISGLVPGLLAAQPAPQHFDGQTWWNHVKVLADDNMEGRETGSPGLRRAQAYIVAQLTKAGLQPAGVDGFYQPVKLVQREIDEKNSSAALIREGKIEPLSLGEDAYFNTRVDLAAEEIVAPLVFAGYGLRIPEKSFDDFSGLDLHGKIVVFLAGSPATFPALLPRTIRRPSSVGRLSKPPAPSVSFRFRIPLPWTSRGRGCRSTAPIPRWISPALNSTRPRVSRCRSLSIPRRPRSSSRAPATPSRRSPSSARIASPCRVSRSPRRSRRAPS